MLFNFKEENRKWWLLISIVPCLAMFYIDQTAVAVMLPQLHHDLGMNEVMQQWVINAYLLTLTVLLIIGGKLSDVIGNRRALLFGLIGFLFASILCSIANNGTTMIIGRALQGVFNAILSPNMGGLILATFPPKQRGTAMGIYGGCAAIFLPLGPLLGGLFTQFFSWRLIFWINLPLILFSFVIASQAIPGEKSKINFSSFKIDWLGFSTILVASISLVVALMEGGVFGWNSLPILSLFATALVGYIAFIKIEKNVEDPLIDLQIFRNKRYLLGLTIVACLQFGIIVRVFWATFLQLGLGYLPFMAGLLMVPATAVNFILAPIAGRMIDKHGPKWPMGGGLVILALGLLWVGWFATTLNYWQILLGTILSGVGIAFVGNPLIVALSEIGFNKQGVANGIFQQFRQFGGTMGIAIMGAIISNFDMYYFHHYLVKADLTAKISTSVDNILTGTQVAKNQLNQLPSATVKLIHTAAVKAYALAFQHAMLAAFIFALIVSIIALRKLKNKPLY